MELEEIIRKRWEREPLAISDDMTGDFARNDILDLLDAIDRVKAQRDALAAALANLFNNSLSEDETRLLMVIAGGSTMANPKDETGRANHARCDRIKAAREQARTALALVVDTAGQEAS